MKSSAKGRRLRSDSTSKPAASSRSEYVSGDATKDAAGSVAQGSGNSGWPGPSCIMSKMAKTPPGLSTRARLGHQGGLVLNVHAHVQQRGRVELPGSERQVQGAGLGEGHAVGQAGAPGQGLGHLDELAGHVHAVHQGAEPLGEEPGRSTDAAAEVKHPGSGADARAEGEVLGRLRPADVELVDALQIFRGDVLGVLADGPQRLQYPLLQIAPGVVFGDGFGRVHGGLPVKDGLVRASLRPCRDRTPAPGIPGRP